MGEQSARVSRDDDDAFVVELRRWIQSLPTERVRLIAIRSPADSFSPSGVLGGQLDRLESLLLRIGLLFIPVLVRGEDGFDVAVGQFHVDRARRRGIEAILARILESLEQATRFLDRFAAGPPREDAEGLPPLPTSPVELASWASRACETLIRSFRGRVGVWIRRYLRVIRPFDRENERRRLAEEAETEVWERLFLESKTLLRFASHPAVRLRALCRWASLSVVSSKAESSHGAASDRGGTDPLCQRA
jgi:hypothetical protein